jgi:protein-S-isoprenylcysteine O-methyltransferase Ste14
MSHRRQLENRGSRLGTHQQAHRSDREQVDGTNKESGRASRLQRLLITVGQFFFKYRDYLFPLVFLPVALGTEPRMLFDDPRADRWLDALGLLLIAAGQGLRACVIGWCFIERGGRQKRVHASKLLQAGVFAWSRNPLYVGNLLIVTGLVLVHNGTWMYVVLIPFFVLVYVSIVAAEESFLRRQFGAEYAEYCRRVPRFLPNPRGVHRSLEKCSFDWRRIVRLEHSTTFASLTALLLILAWKQVSEYGIATTKPHLCVLAIVWMVLVAAYASVRVLKKRGTLSSS